jgi:hypothetical protein
MATNLGGDRMMTQAGVPPDARNGKHGQFYVGYLVDVAMDADSEIVTAVNVLPANGAEAVDAVILTQQEEAAQANNVQADKKRKKEASLFPFLWKAQLSGSSSSPPSAEPPLDGTGAAGVGVLAGPETLGEDGDAAGVGVAWGVGNGCESVLIASGIHRPCSSRFRFPRAIVTP